MGFQEIIMSIARTYFKSSEKKPEIITWPEIWKAAQWRREGASLKAKSELITKSSCRKKQKKKKKNPNLSQQIHPKQFRQTSLINHSTFSC